MDKRPTCHDFAYIHTYISRVATLKIYSRGAHKRMKVYAYYFKYVACNVRCLVLVTVIHVVDTYILKRSEVVASKENRI